MVFEIQQRMYVWMSGCFTQIFLSYSSNKASQQCLNCMNLVTVIGMEHDVFTPWCFPPLEACKQQLSISNWLACYPLFKKNPTSCNGLVVLLFDLYHNVCTWHMILLWPACVLSILPYLVQSVEYSPRKCKFC